LTTPCIPNWQCSDWQPLPEEIPCGERFEQKRTCNDLNNCGTEEGKPLETQEAIGSNSSFCQVENAIGTCENHQCVFQCQQGFLNSDNDWTNGCEKEILKTQDDKSESQIEDL